MQTTIKNDLLLTALAATVQSVEALWKKFDRQDELLACLSQEPRAMINSFYNNGYFVPRGDAWNGFVQLMNETFDVDFENDLMKMDDAEFRRQFYVDVAPADLIDAAFAFIDSFEG